MVSSYDRPTIRPNFSYMPPRQAIAALIKHQHRAQLQTSNDIFYTYTCYIFISKSYKLSNTVSTILSTAQVIRMEQYTLGHWYSQNSMVSVQKRITKIAEILSTVIQLVFWKMKAMVPFPIILNGFIADCKLENRKYKVLRSKFTNCCLQLCRKVTWRIVFVANDVVAFVDGLKQSKSISNTEDCCQTSS